MKRPRPWLVWLITLLMTMSLVSAAVAGRGERVSGPLPLPIEEPGDMNGEPDTPIGPGDVRVRVPVELARMVFTMRVIPIAALPALLFVKAPPSKSVSVSSESRRAGRR